MSNLNDLKIAIEELRTPNHEGDKYFVPQERLYGLMTVERLEKVLPECKVPRQHIPEAVAEVHSGLRKILALLVINDEAEMIVNFIKEDQLQISSMDQKLPFQSEQLTAILPQGTPTYKIRNLYDKQWEFIAPVFSGKLVARLLDNKIILPIVEENKISDGGFGTVYEIKLCEGYCAFSGAKPDILVRKEFIRSGPDFEFELENLSILKHLKHPNIVELLGSYTHKKKQNLLFPKADFGNLEQLFSSTRQLSLSLKISLVVGLANLSSALSAVHNFTANNINMQKIGFHRDIKPKNILVNGTDLILADFGLSSFKEPGQTSRTRFSMEEDYYLAPECQDLDGEFEKYLVRRSSDIWSFGCIIAEFLTYLIHGSAGVSTFKEARKFKLGSWTYYHFHCGKENPNREVGTWLSDLEKICSGASPALDLATCKMFIRLAKDMLAIAPGVRQRAPEVESRICYIAISMEAHRVAKTFCRFRSRIQTGVEAFIQETRFLSWQRALQIIGDSGDQTDIVPSATPVVKSFTETIRLIHEMNNILDDALSSEQSPKSRIFLPLRHLITSLLSQLPQDLKKDADTYLELRLLNSNDSAQLKTFHESALQHVLIDRRLGMLVAMRRMTLLTREKSDQDPPEMPVKPTLSLNEPGKIVVGYLSDENSCGDQQVLVEWKYYGEHWDQHGKELLQRIRGITKLLSSIADPHSLRVLNCTGFFHSPENFAFGLVFKYPQKDSEAKILSLQDLLNKPEQRPLLETRFKIAHNLSTSVFEFHKLKWLHKGVSSSNVVFFKSVKEQASEFMKEPYLVGFVHSRKDDELAFTEGPPEGYQDYEHPDYRGYTGTRFRPEFDYYGLGVVLLELGLWLSVSEMTKGDDWRGIDYSQFRKRLISRRVPQLGQSMGSKYRDATLACLQWTTYDGEEGTDISEALAFQQLTIGRLAQCLV